MLCVYQRAPGERFTLRGVYASKSPSMLGPLYWNTLYSGEANTVSRPAYVRAGGCPASFGPLGEVYPKAMFRAGTTGDLLRLIPA